MPKVNIKSNIPNFITLSNLFLGFVSIVLLALSLASNDINLKIACYLIFIAAFLDTLDGKVARKLKISSDFGKEIDSLADLISFCLVPSLLIFVWYSKISEIQLIPLIFLSSFPIILGAIRLAKYNAIRNMRESVQYIGMPTPANAIWICSLILFTMNFPLYESGILNINFVLFQWMYNLLEFIPSNKYSILYMSIFSSILLMSKVDYNKFPLISFKINKKNSIDLFNLILFCLILILSILLNCYDIVLLFFILIYIFGNFIKYLYLFILK